MSGRTMCDHNWILILTSDFMPAGRRQDRVGYDWRVCKNCSEIQSRETGRAWRKAIKTTNPRLLQELLASSRPVEGVP